MHAYLRAVGFSEIQSKKETDALIKKISQQFDKKVLLHGSPKGEPVFAELIREYSEDIGVVIRGELSKDGSFEPHYYFPYFYGRGISICENVEVERHAEKNSYAGICDEIRIGVTMIFYLQNMVEYFNYRRSSHSPKNQSLVALTALSISGSILLPVQKTEKEITTTRQSMQKRNHLIKAARDGDEEAMESLTLEDMDLYSMISKRVIKEDVFSIVNSTFMPYGVESDQYNILAEILDVDLISNSLTGEELYRMSLDCNNLIFELCINKKDLLGEPAIGRRFKGPIWMQGRVI